MGLFDSIGKILTNPTNLLAIATMNPAIIAATLGRQLVSAIGQEIIQQLGQELGLPQSMIDMAQGSFAASMGDTQGAQQNYREALNGLVSELQDMGARPTDIGNVQRSADRVRSEAETAFRDLINEAMNRGLHEEGAEDAEGNLTAQGKGSILMRIAVALGQNMDKKMEDMAIKAEELGNLGANSDLVNTDDDGNTTFAAEGQSRYGQMSAELQALGQELKILQESLNNTLKSIGESSSAMARKN